MSKVLPWAAATNYQRLAGLNNKHLFLMVLEAVKSKIKALEDPVSDEGPIPGCRWPSSPCILVCSSYKDTNPSWGSILMTSSPPKDPISQYHHFRALTYEFGGNTDI